MASQPNNTVCGLPNWVAFPSNDSTSYINDGVAVAVNIPLSIFAFLSNLTIVVIVTRTPQLHKPCNILLCSLAAADCLTGVTSQPLYFIWRLMLHRAQQSCDFQTELLEMRRVFNTLTGGWSFGTLTLMSFDRTYALSKPLLYRAEVTNQGTIAAALITWVTWLLLTIFIHFFLPHAVGYAIMLISAGLFILLPTVNHVRMFLSVRRHNNQVVGDVNQQQLMVIFRREKKVASDMLIVSITLFACLGPILIVKLAIFYTLPKLYDLLYPWAFTMIYLNSSINPVLYITRNKELRSALKAVRPICF